MNLTTDFGQIEAVIQQKIDQNRGKVRVAADLSTQGIAEIQAEERMQGQLAEEALSNFEVELGLKSPETTPLSRRPRISGRPRRSQTTNSQQRQSSVCRTHIWRTDNPDRPSTLPSSLVVVGLVGLALWRYGAIGGGGGTAQFSNDELKQMKGGAEAPDSSGITTVKEYNFVAGGEAARPSRASPATSRWSTARCGSPSTSGPAGPDHLREQRLQAREGLEDAGRQGLQGRARADRRSGRDARRVRRRQPPRRLGHARHDAAVPRGAAQGHPRRCRASTSRSTGPTAATASSCATRSRRWPTCAARRSCSRRTRRRTSSC